MDTFGQSLRVLQSLLVPGISPQEDKEIRAEIEMLKDEMKKCQKKDNDLHLGISNYGSYFNQ
jgi:hypothetical protein